MFLQRCWGAKKKKYLGIRNLHLKRFAGDPLIKGRATFWAVYERRSDDGFISLVTVVGC